MIFAGIVKTSLIDYPGKIATVLFAPGCNYNCFYCHNRSLIEDFTELLDQDEIDDYLIRRQGLIDAVVISGGEPTLYNDIIPFFSKIRDLGYLTKLDTNGSNPGVIRRLIAANVVDYYAVDYKAPKDRYQEICGEDADANKVLATIDLLIQFHQDFEIRTTVVPQLSLEDLVQMAKEMPLVPRYVLNPYRIPKKYQPCDQDRIDVPPYSEKQIAEFSETVKLYQPNVVLMF
ncbi:MAG: anaerobic ribonucleoside-triphosphate reductase activating protein [Candidatus Izemoplasmatales bacterium]|jgi:pyruvate formate lyase activating enzyme|nr:anaerobic ribonucleoside-triphosphate reductase activating protein [Candidatus Izemoplasmatales bacterium]MDD3865816.1 anaerobic ribonucleoside-triphosphate reductase activating protein [Candidatus Izemoplasmatales bacterium]